MGLLKPPEKPDKRWKVPQTRDEYLRQINATYALNNWGESERAANHLGLKLEPKPLREYSDLELKIILDDLEKFKMILFED